MLKIKKNDTVKVLSGRDRGKTGKVLQLYLAEGKALVEGINVVKKHMRRVKEGQQAGIVSVDSPINISNIMLVCGRCHKATRVGFTVLKDGTKARVCKNCKETL
ncbi:MAG: 50S ribosomal protein L24 [Candidatus Omnitrophica bacterium]|nr:50S ribosomal protein L24 [Candidatus Omnitrophota bacterium]